VKFVVEQAPLVKALSHLQSVVERRGTIPILGNVLMKAEGGSVALSTTDLDIELVETLSAQVATPGTTTAPTRMLYEIARKLNDGSQIELQLDKGMLTVRSGKSRFSVPVLPPEDYPVMSDGDLPHNFKLATADLATLIDCTKFAISTEETRYYLNGIYLHVIDGRPSNQGAFLRAVTTNGHQLARADVEMPEGAAEMNGVIVPRKTVIELRKLLDGAGEVDVSVGKTKIRFAMPGAILTSKLIDGTFPDYSRVIPEGNDKTIEIVREEFMSAVDRVATIDIGRTRAIKMTASDGNLALAAQNAETGSASEDIDARYQGPTLDIGFNSRYLLDIAGQIKGDSLRFELKDGGAPAVIRAADSDRALYVLMPMRI
jgi:DNA polymerase-3 subunit beta